MPIHEESLASKETFQNDEPVISTNNQSVKFVQSGMKRSKTTLKMYS